MYLVYDINLVLCICRGIFHLFYDFTHVVYTVVSSGIYLYYIKSPSLSYLLTGITDSTRASVYCILTVYSLGKYLSHTGLTRSPGSREHISMPDFVVLNLVFKHSHHLVLSLYLIKSLWSEFSI